jgi:anaerobic ribonucleoside-triphosphate reductase activating protein
MDIERGWGSDPTVLHVARRSPRCTVLGPGVRAVVWVQGCPFRCPGCVAPETLPFEGGTVAAVDDLAREIVELPEIEGVTVSGGEPMVQAAALCRLVDRIRDRRDLSFLSYTGYTLDSLRRRGDAAQAGLLDRLDILIDGLYVAARHTDLLWRGSDNQRVHFLGPRYRHLEPMVGTRSRRLEFEFDPDGGVSWMGIPPAGFREEFERRMELAGIELRTRGSAR